MSPIFGVWYNFEEIAPVPDPVLEHKAPAEGG